MPHTFNMVCAAILMALLVGAHPGRAHVIAFSETPLACPRPVGEAGRVALLPDSPGSEPEVAVAGLLAWIADVTDYDVSASLADPPEIDFCDTGDWVAYEGDSVLVEDSLRAVYDLTRRRILIVRPFDAGQPRDLSVLLHELVHDVQYLNRSWDCPNATEWQAYKLQEQWLAEQGIDAGFDWLQIYFLSRCPRDVHP